MTLEEQKDAADEVRVDAILRGSANRERVVLDGEVIHVHAVPETIVATLHARASLDAAARFASEGVEADERSLAELAQRLLERALLVEACRTKASGQRFASVEELDAMDASSVATLLEAFRVAAQRAGTMPSDDDEKLDAVVQRVAQRRSIDMLRARHSDLASFFGLCSAREASMYQVLYFSTCHRGPNP